MNVWSPIYIETTDNYSIPPPWPEWKILDEYDDKGQYHSFHQEYTTFENNYWRITSLEYDFSASVSLARWMTEGEYWSSIFNSNIIEQNKIADIFNNVKNNFIIYAVEQVL